MKRHLGFFVAVAVVAAFAAPKAQAATSGNATVTLAASASTLVQIVDANITLVPTTTDYDNDYVEAVGASGLRVRVRSNSSTGMVLRVRCSDATPQIALADLLFKTQTAAGRLNLQLHSLPISGDTSVESAFEKIKKQSIQALIVVTDPILYSQRNHILALAAQNQLPAMYPYRGFPDAGGLISYAPNDRDIFRRAASYVDRILKGANPGDLPVEQPTKFELVINLKTAKALSLTIPPTLLATADEVIE